MPEIVFSEAPYDNEEAHYLRELGFQIVGCWFCLNRGVGSENAKPGSQRPNIRPYWPEEMTTIKFGEHVIRCPKHRDES